MGSDVNFSTFVHQIQTTEWIYAITLWYKVKIPDNTANPFSKHVCGILRCW